MRWRETRASACHSAVPAPPRCTLCCTSPASRTGNAHLRQSPRVAAGVAGCSRAVGGLTEYRPNTEPRLQSPSSLQAGGLGPPCSLRDSQRQVGFASMGWGWGHNRSKRNEPQIEEMEGVTVYDPPRRPMRRPDTTSRENRLVFWDRGLQRDGCRRCTDDTAQGCDRSLSPHAVDCLFVCSAKGFWWRTGGGVDCLAGHAGAKPGHDRAVPSVLVESAAHSACCRRGCACRARRHRRRRSPGARSRYVRSPGRV